MKRKIIATMLCSLMFLTNIISWPMASIDSIKSADALDHWLVKAAQNVGYLSHQLPEAFLKDVPGFAIEEFNAFFNEVVAGRRKIATSDVCDAMTAATFFQALLNDSMPLSRIDAATRRATKTISTDTPLLSVRAEAYASHFYQMAALILLNMVPYVSYKMKDTAELFALKKMQEKPTWKGLKEMLGMLDTIFREDKIFQTRMANELTLREREGRLRLPAATEEQVIVQVVHSRNKTLLAGGIAVFAAISACCIALKYTGRI